MGAIAEVGGQRVQRVPARAGEGDDGALGVQGAGDGGAYAAAGAGD